MDAAILTVGEELLAGDIENTNATWIARRLSDRGVSVRRVLTVPDDVNVIADAVRTYSDAFDAVVVTGGLGGTPDDVTMDGVAAAFDVRMVEDDLARRDVERTLSAIEDDYPELDVDVTAEASIPAGSRLLLNREGLSPGCVLENVYVLPGIPVEMRAMFEDVAEEFSGGIESRLLYTEEPESNLTGRLEEIRTRFDVTVGCYPEQDTGHNRLKLSSEDPGALCAAVEWVESNVTIVE